MELIKVILFFAISIACSLSQTTEETQAAVEHDNDDDINMKIKGPQESRNCNRGDCRRNKGQANIEQRCTCFPLNNDNALVPQYIKNDGNYHGMTRIVVYIYTIGNKSAIYIPNQRKQSLYTDLTLDEDDVLRPISSNNVKLLTVPEYDPHSQISQETNNNYIRRVNVQETENQSLEQIDLPNIIEGINNDALNDVLEGDLNMLAQNNYPKLLQDFGQNAAPSAYDIGIPQLISDFNPPENEYIKHVDKPVIALKPGDTLVHDTVGSQKDYDIYPNDNENDLPQIITDPVYEINKNKYGLYPTKNELYENEINKPKDIIVPYDISDSNIGSPSEKEVNFPLKGIGLNREDNQLHAIPLDAFALEPIAQDAQIHKIDRPVVVSGLNPKKTDLHLPRFDKPIKKLEPKPIEEDINVYPEFNVALDSDADYLPLPNNDKPLNILGSNAKENNPDINFGLSPNEYSLQPNVEPQKDFEFSSLLNTIPLKGFESIPKDNDFYYNHVAHPQKVEPEINNNDLTSASLFKPQPNIRCSSGICKLYIYCSRNDCNKYLQSLAKLHTTIHKHPYLENTFVAINNGRANVTYSDLKPFLNVIGLEDTDEAVQNIRSIQLEDQNPSYNQHGHLLSQQVPKQIPINLSPSSRRMSDQGPPIQQLQGLIHGRRHNPRNKQMLSTPHRNLPHYRDLFIPRPMNQKYYRRNGAMTPKNENNFLKDLLLLPSQIRRKGVESLSDFVSNLSFRKNNLNEEEGALEEIEVPVDEDDIKIKIIGGQPAVSSGTPMQIKARIGDVV